MSEYRPFDREEKLGPPPWKSDDPKLIAWEKAHGHDVRLKCFPEFGCQVIQERAEEIEAASRAIIDNVNDVQWRGGRPHLLVPQGLIVRLREALER